eukprot:2201194-Pyramimonas_sp.AAC.2
MCAVGACARSHSSLPWTSLLGHATCEGVPKWARRAHASAPTEAFGRAPDEARARVRGVSNGCGVRVRAQPLRPSVKLPKGAQLREGRAEMHSAGACERSHWSLRRSPQMWPQTA